MRYRDIPLEQALDLEHKGEVILYYPVDLQHAHHFHPDVDRWIDNFEELSFKYRKVPLSSVLEFINVNYRIEVLVDVQNDPPSATWTYLYAKEISELQKQELPKDRYVYILTNEHRPGICKIGKAVNPQQRLRSINGAGVIEEWDLRYTQPVIDDYQVEGQMHKIFAPFRMSSSKGHSREFFEIEYEDAVQALKGLAEDFGTGEPTIF